MWSQLARIEWTTFVTKRMLMNPSSLGPMKKLVKVAGMEQKILRSKRKHWYCGGNRSIAMAVSLLQKGKVIAVPTDTIYGLTGLAQCDKAIAKIYEIKKRDFSKPLAICLNQVEDIDKWSYTDILPEGMLQKLLPGPVTVILKRKPTLNPNLNPDLDNVGIRVPQSFFIRSVIKVIGEPLALTSANESNKPSTLYPEEFENLWSDLDGIFYSKCKIKESSIRRAGSTIVDLTERGQFKIVRVGRALHSTRKVLLKFGLEQYDYPSIAQKAEASG